jgi:hypothetical protein
MEATDFLRWRRHDFDVFPFISTNDQIAGIRIRFLYNTISNFAIPTPMQSRQANVLEH